MYSRTRETVSGTCQRLSSHERDEQPTFYARRVQRDLFLLAVLMDMRMRVCDDQGGEAQEHDEELHSSVPLIPGTTIWPGSRYRTWSRPAEASCQCDSMCPGKIRLSVTTVVRFWRAWHTDGSRRHELLAPDDETFCARMSRVHSVDLRSFAGAERVRVGDDHIIGTPSDSVVE